MSASLKFLDPFKRYAEFFIDEEADLVTLPTTKKSGTGAFSTLKDGIAQGSLAILTNSGTIYYRIRGDDTWIKIVVSGGGGGGGELVDYNTQVINKPTINGKPLEGNVTSDDIDVAPEPTVSGGKLIIG